IGLQVQAIAGQCRGHPAPFPRGRLLDQWARPCPGRTRPRCTSGLSVVVAIEGGHVDGDPAHARPTGTGLDLLSRDPIADPLTPDVVCDQALVPDGLPAGAGGLTGWDQVPGPGPGDLERISGEDDHIPALATGVGDVAAQDLPAWFPACGPA